MIDSPGLRCNNFNPLELIWYEFRNRAAFTEIPPNATLALLAVVVMEFAMFMIWPQAGSLLMGLEKRVWNV